MSKRFVVVRKAGDMVVALGVGGGLPAGGGELLGLVAALLFASPSHLTLRFNRK